MANISFQKSGETPIDFGASIRYPVEKPQQAVQATDRTAGGTLVVENLGVYTQRRVLQLVGLSAAVVLSLRNWHQNIAVGAANEFTYVDESGSSNTVVWVDDEFNPLLNNNDTYSAVINLEVTA